MHIPLAELKRGMEKLEGWNVMLQLVQNKILPWSTLMFTCKRR